MLSGIGKILDMASFKDLLYRQNLPEIIVALALLIPPLEILSCLCIVLNINRKFFLFFLLFLTVIFTFYLLHLYFNNLQDDCGCFGQIKILNLSVKSSIIKNIILILLILYTIFYLRSEHLSIKFSKESFLFVVSVFLFFFSGFFSFNHTYEQSQVSENLPGYALKQKIVFGESVIARIVSLSADSTYLLYVFNPSCRHCALSVENVKSFIRNKVVDKIIGISSAEEHSVQAFSKKFDLGFETILAPRSQIQKFAPSLPTVFIVRHDTIVSRMSGEVIPSYLLEP